ncbi:MAG: hypothetical protein ACYDIC_15195 [Desulfobaccales bacterium]
MKKIWVIIFNCCLLGLPVLAWAAAEKAESLDRKVDLANLSGINLFFARYYNDNLWAYAAITTVLMGTVGFAIALVTDVFLKMVGMEVSKIEHHE